MTASTDRLATTGGRWSTRGGRCHLAAARVGVVVWVAVAGLVSAGAPASADHTRDTSWQVDALKLSKVHKITQGEGVVVAVIDTGVNPDHQDLKGNVLSGFDVTVAGNPERGHRDTNGHGTAMASLIAGHGHGSGGRDGVLGVAPKAKILPLDVTDPGSGEVVRGSVGTAIRLAVDHGADVICVALGGRYEANERTAIRYAYEHDVVVVAGVGNPPAPLVQAPASDPLALAATGYGKDGKVATTVTGDVDIAAPGADIVIALPGNRYGTGTGTSASTALVAGTLALVLAEHPGLSRNEQVERIVFTATDIGEKGKDPVFGWGAINVVEAVTGTPHPPTTAAAPTATGGLAGAGPGEEDTGGDSGGTSIGLAVWLAVLGGIVFVGVVLVGGALLLIRSRRRARRTVSTSFSDE